MGALGIKIAAWTLLCLVSNGALANESGIQILTSQEGADGQTEYSVSIQILGIMTMLTLIPAMLMMMTCFTRIIIVFSILRQAMGLQQTPSNQVLIGLSLFLTLFIMKPVFESSTMLAATIPGWHINIITSVAAASEPLRAFMLDNVREQDVQTFLKLAGMGPVASTQEVPFHVLVPAFVTSELKTAFQIGFMLFIPFLIIDLVVASVLMAMGMMMMSPVIVSLPFKLLLFVVVDGWSMVVGTLAASFGVN